MSDPQQQGYAPLHSRCSARAGCSRSGGDRQALSGRCGIHQAVRAAVVECLAAPAFRLYGDWPSVNIAARLQQAAARLHSRFCSCGEIISKDMKLLNAVLLNSGAVTVLTFS